MTRSYTFLWSPKWLSLILLVGALVVAMLWLASWQFDRLDERRAENAVMEAGLYKDPGDLAGILSDPDAIHAFTHATAEGEYLPDAQIWVQGRSLDDNPGLWLLAPFRWSSGETIMVVRGWVPVTRVTPIEEAPPAGLVSLTGVLIPGEVQRNVGPQDRVDSGLFTRVDLEIIGQQLGLSLGTVYLQLTAPDVSNGPVALSAPVVEGEGPHKGYALQWISFSLTALVGLGALVRNEAGKQAGSV
jgi:cytochrome oxidase assembly protein ShyY1